MGGCCAKEEQFEVEEELFDPADFLKVEADRDGDRSPGRSVGYCDKPAVEQEMVQVCPHNPFIYNMISVFQLLVLNFALIM